MANVGFTLNPRDPFAISKTAMEAGLNIRTLFKSGKAQRKQLESSPDTISALYQDNLQSAIAAFETCRTLADRISLFSQNETEEDISSGDLQ